MNNRDVIQLLKKEKIYQWEVAKCLGIHETTLCRWFSDELNQEQIQLILSAVNAINQERLSKD